MPKHYLNLKNNQFNHSYSKLRMDIFHKVGGFMDITSSKPQPTKKNHTQGYMWRYFCVKNNTINSYFEIDEDIYKSLSSKKPEYNHTLYTAGKLKWALKGDIKKANTNSLIQSSRTFPNIHLLFPKLNEFHNKPLTPPSVIPPYEETPTDSF